MRLDKFVSHATGASRSQVHLWLRQGRISLNGTPCTQAALNIKDNEQICLDEAPIQLPREGYWLLHKPAGVVCANQDGQYPTVIDLVSHALAPGNLQIAGRLDVDTTGMVLITTDGAWNHQVTAPKKHCQKIYQVTLSEPLTPAAIAHLRAGIALREEPKPCLPADIFALSHHEYLLAINEGKYHQVKRMMAAANSHVVKLHRLAVGGLCLNDLEPGAFRPLTGDEIRQLATSPQTLNLASLAQSLFAGLEPTHV
ncbi:MAG TPA: pseudouridine synthase [Marinagarivorans sp.]|nr:pseudouridine synthase [Marinagarivorans sp.]HNG60384.1 pseudouridine synthase [Cellvibrionaceae bacterium]